MTLTQFAPTRTARIKPGTRLARAARAAWRAYWRWRGRQATVHILRALDARTLRDIGMSPSEIESFVHGLPGGLRRAYDEDWWCGSGRR
jgi:uncharacterized protein YjiS (DUF1127 family)